MRSFLRAILFDNLSLKLVSLVLGLVLFLLVREDRVKELEVQIPVAIPDLGETHMFTADIPSSVKVRLRGRWSRLLRVLESRPAPYELDAPRLVQGDTYVFDEERLKRSIGVAGLAVVGVEPPSLPVRIEQRASKVVPIKLETVGESAPGYTIERSQIRFYPQEVELVGPKSALEDILLVETHPVDLTGLSRDLRSEIGLRKPGKRFVTLKVDRVSVEVPVQEELLTDELVDVPVHVTNCSPTMTCAAEPSRVRLTATGPTRRIRELKEHTGQPLVYIDAFQHSQHPGAYKVVPILSKRFDRLLFDVTPAVVSLTVEPLLPPIPDEPPDHEVAPDGEEDDQDGDPQPSEVPRDVEPPAGRGDATRGRRPGGRMSPR